MTLETGQFGGDLNDAQNPQTETKEDEPEKQNLVEQLNEKPVTLIDSDPKYLALDYIESLAPDKNILVCDGNISDFFAEKDENGNDLDEPVQLEDSIKIEGGFQKDNITNIDHHFPIPDFSKQISTTNLAIEYVKKHGPVDKDTVVVITHTDCDSILSSAIMRGILPPDDKFGAAAIAADHTGEADQIADLLNSFNDERSIEFSLRNLQLFMDGKELEPEAQEYLKARLNNRELAKSVAENEMKISDSGNIYYVQLKNKIESELIPDLIPDAKIIVLISPMKNKKTGEAAIEVKARLGLAAPEGTVLKKIMKKVDPIWNGRWNAGSDKRNGGLDPDKFNLDDFISALDKETTEYFNNLKKNS